MHKPLEHFHDELNQLFAKACEEHQNGLLDAARQSYLELLDYFAEAPILHYNLGLVYYGQGEYQLARDSFAMAVELHPGDTDILFNLALSKKRTGDLIGAIDTYKKVLAIDPASVDTLYNLAGCYKDSLQYALAMDTYREVLRQAPQHQSANNNLAFLYHLTGDSEAAVRYYRRVLEINPDHQGAQHMVAALTGAPVTNSPELYVKAVFDNYADYFDRSLVTELEYSVPSAIRDLLDTTFAGRRKFVHGLDLGCGTGLGGQAFTDIIEVFDGLDLSAKMLAVAAKKGIYRKLHPGSIVSFPKELDDSFDFYLAADVFAYVGDLRETFCLLRQRARHDVLFCFSTESDAGNAYTLKKTGRFAHSPQYIKELAQATGWQVIASQETGLRKEKGVWVKGDLWLLQLA
ncbi:MAG: tetratricopeptide repeat protein [Proteobacteria bacterium]|nr:tetratricopeptide repeat protein [Pseudomonadota bacterium]